MPRLPGTVAAAVLLAPACTAPPPQPDFDSAASAAKLRAIARAAGDPDPAAAPRLVEQLDSADPAVRMAAISALKRLTGRTYDYRYDDPPPRRRVAVRRWVEAVATGEIGVPEPSVEKSDG